VFLDSELVRHACLAVSRLGEAFSAALDEAATTLALDDADTRDGRAVTSGSGSIFSGHTVTTGFGVVGNVDAVKSTHPGVVSALLVATRAGKITLLVDARSFRSTKSCSRAFVRVQLASTNDRGLAHHETSTVME